MKQFDKKSLTEVYRLIELLDEESYEKIPENIIKGIKENIDNEYEVDRYKLLNGEYSKQAGDILCAIYTNYLATEEEREVILNYAKSLKEKEEMNQVKYDVPEDIFGKKNEETQIKIDNSLEVIQDKEANKNIFSYILEKIKKLFKK